MAKKLKKKKAKPAHHPAAKGKKAAKAKKPIPRPKAKGVSKKPAKAPKPALSGKKRELLEAKAGKLIAKGKERGYVTYNEILKEFPTIEENVVFLEELYERLSTSGVDVLESGGMLEEVPDEVVMRGGYRG